MGSCADTANEETHGRVPFPQSFQNIAHRPDIEQLDGVAGIAK